MPILIRRAGAAVQTYTDLVLALKNLIAGDTLDVSDHVATDIFTIAVNNVTLQNTGAPVTVQIAAGVGTFTLAAGATAVVQAEGPDTTIHGNDIGNDFFGGAARDRINGGAGAETIDGGGGDDLLYGGGGDDVLIAGAGRDQLFGGSGTDLLISDQGMNRLWSGAGADVLELHVDADQNTIVFDFTPEDTIRIVGHGGLTSLADVVAAGGKVYESGANTIIRIGEAQIQLRDTTLADLTPERVVFVQPPPPPPAEIMVGEVAYRLRDGEPPHENFKFQDAAGRWYSPDYFVLVAGGQSNMVGSSKTGDYIMNGDVMAYDWLNDRIVAGDYGSVPATGREGASARNNLYFPMAVELTEALDRPVLVVNRAVSGSRIDTWLDTQLGHNWAALSDDVTQALAHVGQASADAFIWLQGESDYPLKTSVYAGYVQELIAQVRATGWAPDDLDILMGELSRESANYVQNGAYQMLELANTDADLGFVSSAGLGSNDRDGVHFSGQSLNAFGTRFAQALLDLRNGVVADPNSAPTSLVTGTVGSLTVVEGQELRVHVADYFSDADGDALFYYSYLSRRAVQLTFEDQATDEIVLRPGFGSAGTYKVFVYANDYDLDGGLISFDLTVTKATPLIDTYNSRDFTQKLSSFAAFDAGMASLSTNKGIDILDQAALAATTTLTVDSLHIRGGAGISGNFVLGDAALRAYFLGQATFSVTGNGRDNYIVGGDGDSIMRGGAGLDRLYGGMGHDMLTGDAGNDQLFGGAGDDRLWGGTGSDIVTGGAGNDTFVFQQGDNALRIEDYTLGDTIALQGFADIDSYATLMAQADRVYQSSTRTIIDLGDDRLMLSNFQVGNLSADMFHFA
ncbi:Hemolysin-type calcium-binding repeat-containing protein [Loktanella fryxellensis]|uniref:Hemolysin-type calcium-binding repeat-containing protein n=1 Tax=Loktanella fryxellensis TaxID=245187 RepID=A0A1H8H2L2_9RHOB|nr:sialate O-acetylesterase [Loktanella fryxellensis]SEN50483.1 Hemolysin-type calcium-binding repeat-containing protein [Loktanella fryxellensis]